MRKILIYFTIAFVPQLLLLILFLTYEIGERFVYFFYMLPYIFLSFLNPFFGPSGSGDCVTCMLGVLLLPAIVYSLIFAFVLRKLVGLVSASKID